MQQLQLNSYVNVHCHDIWWKPKEASFYANEGDKLLHPRNIQNQAICKHFTSHYVSCLSQSVKYLFKHDLQKYP